MFAGDSAMRDTCTWAEQLRSIRADPPGNVRWIRFLPNTSTPRNAWYPQRRKEGDVLTLSGVTFHRDVSGKSKAAPALVAPDTVARYFPMTEEQFRVYLMHQDGRIREPQVLWSAALALWFGLITPEHITDRWMHEWTDPYRVPHPLLTQSAADDAMAKLRAETVVTELYLTLYGHTLTAFPHVDVERMLTHTAAALLRDTCDRLGEWDRGSIMVNGRDLSTYLRTVA